MRFSLAARPPLVLTCTLQCTAASGALVAVFESPRAHASTSSCRPSRASPAADRRRVEHPHRLSHRHRTALHPPRGLVRLRSRARPSSCRICTSRTPRRRTQRPSRLSHLGARTGRARPLRITRLRPRRRRTTPPPSMSRHRRTKGSSGPCACASCGHGTPGTPQTPNAARLSTQAPAFVLRSRSKIRPERRSISRPSRVPLLDRWMAQCIRPHRCTRPPVINAKQWLYGW